ncbi:MAG: hypothetical protein IJP43_03920 [Oscillospiraceae bacterium]|nr:hypothetical protein [Oscillospiraceae bacterium]
MGGKKEMKKSDKLRIDLISTIIVTLILHISLNRAFKRKSITPEGISGVTLFKFSFMLFL